MNPPFPPAATVALLLPAYNEEAFLPALFGDLLAQTYPREKTEILMADSLSSDGTRRLMETFAREYGTGYRRIAVLDNPGRIQACGWNVCIREADTDVVIRVDAHSRLPADFIEKQMCCQNSGETVTGGVCERVAADPSPLGRTLLLAENAALGGGFFSGRRGGTGKRYVPTVSHTAYRRALFTEYGLFDERLPRTEDNEMHWRLRKAGCRICQDPTLRTRVCIRNSPGALLRQKYGNGYWIGVTAKVCPGCLSPFHFTPALLIAALLGAAAAAFAGWSVPLRLLAAAYGLAVLAGTAAGLNGQPFTPMLLLAVFLFPAVHFVYGTGTWIGLIAGKPRKPDPETAGEKNSESGG